MNCTFLLSILLFSSHITPALSPTVFFPDGMTEKQAMQMLSEKKAEHKLEFAFDVHKVLVHKKSNLMWNILKNYPHKSEFIKLFWNLPLMTLLGSIVWQYLINVLPWHKKKYKEVTSERFVNGLQQINAFELVEFTTSILNAQLPDPQMQEVIIELKEKGYPLHIASNIGKQIFIKLKEKLHLLNKNIFALFDKNDEGLEGKTVDYSISRAEKPSPEYYKEYLDQYDPDRSKLIIFVDDKLINILPATAQGFLGIHFKNAQQFRNDLILLGILRDAGFASSSG